MRGVLVFGARRGRLELVRVTEGLGRFVESAESAEGVADVGEVARHFCVART